MTIGRVLWVAMFKAGVAPALSGVLIALAVPMHAAGCRTSSPLRETERRFHPWGVLFVVPLFAFFNAGISIAPDTLTSSLNTISLGVVGGLFLGKQIGVFMTARIAVGLGLAQLPRGVTWRQLYGVALLAGIGFTMSLFVSTLAFPDVAQVASAKLAILFGSLLSAVAGLTLVCVATHRDRRLISQVSGT